MSVDERTLRALSNENRKKIIEYLYNNGATSYSKLMRAIGFGIGESGKFSYHLKKLIDAGLIRQLPDRKYVLTRKGLRLTEIIQEETRDSPSLIDTIDNFLERIDHKKFIAGNLLVYTGIAFGVVSGLKTILSIIGIPAKIQILGNTLYYSPNLNLYIPILILAIILLVMGLYELKKTLPQARILELLIYQKYSYLLLSRSSYLKKFFTLYVFITISWLLMLFIPM